MGVIKERVATPNFDSLLPTLKSPKEVKDILIKNNITGKDDYRPILTCVYFDENGLAVATDAHKVVCVKYDTKDKQFKPFEGKCVNNKMDEEYKESLGGSVIEGIYPNYPAVFPEEAEFRADIEVTKELLLFLKKYASNKQQNKIYIEQGEFFILLNISFLYNILKALYDFGDKKLVVYATSEVCAVSFIGKTTKSLLMPIESEKDMYKGYYESTKDESLFLANFDDTTNLVITDFDKFQKEFREGKYNNTATSEKKVKPLTENDIFIEDYRRIVLQKNGLTAVSDGICAWIEKGEGGMGIEGLVGKCIVAPRTPDYFWEEPNELYELNIKDFVKGFEDYYKAQLQKQEEDCFNVFLEKINKETIKEKVYIPKNYDELAKVWKEGIYTVFVSDIEKPKRYTFTKDGKNQDCFVGISIDDKTLWQTPQNLKKMLGVFTTLGYDVIYIGMIFQNEKPVLFLESTDERYRLIIMRYEHTDENRDYVKKLVGNGVSPSEVQSGVSNFDTMLKMFEGNGIQTEFVDTNEKIIERLKKEGHSDENINFSLQEDFELDDEDNEPKQGTLNFDFWDYQNPKRIANEMYQPIIGEYRGKVEAYNDVITRIGKFKDLGVSGDKIVDEILSQAKHWARFYSELMEENEERIPESAKSIYKELTKKDEGNDKE